MHLLRIMVYLCVTAILRIKNNFQVGRPVLLSSHSCSDGDFAMSYIWYSDVKSIINYPPPFSAQATSESTLSNFMASWSEASPRSPSTVIYTGSSGVSHHFYKLNFGLHITATNHRTNSPLGNKWENSFVVSILLNGTQTINCRNKKTLS